MGIGEHHARGGELVDVRGGNLATFRVVALRVAIAEIVGVNDEDVGLVLLRGISCGEACEEG